MHHANPTKGVLVLYLLAPAGCTVPNPYQPNETSTGSDATSSATLGQETITGEGEDGSDGASGSETGATTDPDSQPSENAQVCRPDEHRSCYTGPPETVGIGECHVGSKVCTENFMWGSCEGEQGPQAESCHSTEDESCDGLSSCTGIVVQCPLLSGSQYQTVSGIAVSPSYVYVTGTHYGMFDFDGHHVPNTGGHDFFLGAVNRQTGTEWVKNFGSDGFQNAEALTLMPDGTILVAGEFRGELAFGGKLTPLIANEEGPKSVFIARLTPDGTPFFQTKITPTMPDGYMHISGLRPSPTGDFYLTGRLSGSIMFEEDVEDAPARALYLTKFNSDNSYAWTTTIHGTSDDSGLTSTDLALNHEGTPHITGTCGNDIAVSGELFTCENDLFVSNFAPENGSLVKMRLFPTDGGYQQASSKIAFDPDNNLLLSGSFNVGLSVDEFGDPQAKGVGANLFVAKFSSLSTTAQEWFQYYHGNGGLTISDISGDSAGNIVLGVINHGIFGISDYYGEYLNLSTDGTQSLVMKLDGSDPRPIWIREVASSDMSATLSLQFELDPGGTLFVGGDTYDSLPTECAFVPPQDIYPDGFLAILAP